MLHLYIVVEGDTVPEVLYPKDVRAEMMKIIKGMGDEYAGVSREDCKKKVPGVKELKALMEDPEQ